MGKIKKSIYFNALILIFEIFSLTWMMSGVKMFAATNNLTASRLSMFKYFTVDSNFIMGIIAFITLLEEIKILKGKKKEPSSTVYILKLLGTTSVTLTMLVTLFFLAPTMGLGVVFSDSNLFLHVINPILSIVAFTIFEKNLKINFKHTFTACLPLIIYSIYYVSLSLIHTEGGKVIEGYDWYGFFFLGIKSIIIILPIILIVTYLISLFLWNLNKERKVKQ